MEKERMIGEYDSVPEWPVGAASQKGDNINTFACYWLTALSTIRHPLLGQSLVL
jgi:hypothetical protein